MKTTSLIVYSRRLVALVLSIAVVALALGCGDSPQATKRGCVIVDVSGGSRDDISGLYLPGFQTFVLRIAQEGSGQVCFAFAAKGMTGGASAWGNFACSDPDDGLRCPPLVRRNVAAAAAQLASAAKTGAAIKGASELLAAIANVAPVLRDGDEILLLSDGIENSHYIDFHDRRDSLDDAAIERLLDRLESERVLPDLTGRSLRIPYLLTRSKKLTMKADRRQAIRTFWERYAARTGATPMLGDGGAEEAQR